MADVGVLKPGTAIPTEFRGITYRSRLEANVAQFLLDMGIKFRYEARSFLVNGKHYSPDFYLPEVDRYVEARGYLTETSEATLEAFVRQQGDLFVFYSDRAEHIHYIPEIDEIFREGLTVQLCDFSHAGVGTLGYHCWLCADHDRRQHRYASLSIVMRNSVPTLITEIGQCDQGFFEEEV